MDNTVNAIAHTIIQDPHRGRSAALVLDDAAVLAGDCADVAAGPDVIFGRLFEAEPEAAPAMIPLCKPDMISAAMLLPLPAVKAIVEPS